MVPSASADGGGFLDVDGLGTAVVDAEDPIVGAAAVDEVQARPVVAVFGLGEKVALLPELGKVVMRVQKSMVKS